MTPPDTLARVEQACAQLLREAEPVTFTTVAVRAGSAEPPSIETPRFEPWSKNTASTATIPALSPASSPRSDTCAPPSRSSPAKSGATKTSSAA